VRLRHKRTCPKQVIGKNSLEGLDGTGRKTPAIADKILRQIEDANPHLAESEVVDEIIWKDCVNYKFKLGGPSRPLELLYPWPILVEKLNEVGRDLISILKSDTFDLESLQKTIKMLDQTPMNVKLLSDCDIGKYLKKFIKACGKMQDGDDRTPFDRIWTPRPGGQPSPLQKLENVMQKWKNIASASGVSVAGSKKDGKMKSSNDAQHAMDMTVCRAVRSWRDLHCALCERESKMMLNHGAKMREIRERLNTRKHQVKTAHVKTSRMVAKHNDILDKKKGLGALRFEAKKFAGTTTVSKISLLKRETQQAVLRSKAGMGQASRSRSYTKFGANCAAACGQRKRPDAPSSIKPEMAFGRRGELDLGSGKRMKMPTQKSDGVFANVQHQIRIRKGVNR